MVYDQDDNVLSVPVENSMVAHLGLVANLKDRVRLFAVIPFQALQSGDPGTVNGRLYEAEEGARLGDVRVGVDVRLLGAYRSAFTLAAGVGMHLPSGTRDSYTSDGKVRLQPRLMMAGMTKHFSYAGRLGFDFRFVDLDDTFGARNFGQELDFAFAGGVRLADGVVTLGPEVYGSTILGDGIFGNAGTPVEVIFGGHFLLADSVRLAVGAGPGFNQKALGSPNFRFLAKLGFFPSAEVVPPKDTDNDGIWDADDACPEKPGIPTGVARTHGCPDTDADGFVDFDDACPLVYGGDTGDPLTRGCPDRDKDTVVDKEDACPDTFGVKTDDPKTNGCPDRDGDTIVDRKDACPDLPGPATDDPQTHGCPDRDGDGIVDPVDACPDKPGDPDPDPEKNGCPKVVLVKNEIQILERIEFDTAKATIRPESDPVLGAVFRVLTQHPEIQLLRVEGHTDNRGGRRYNKRLSQERAQAVVAWLTVRGISATRLSPEGFGFDQPIDTNDTREGRQNNRRVQFIILRQDAVPQTPDTSEVSAPTKPAATPQKGALEDIF